MIKTERDLFQYGKIAARCDFQTQCKVARDGCAASFFSFFLLIITQLSFFSELTYPNRKAEVARGSNLLLIFPKRINYLH